jgi:hypothetical protein
MSKHLITDRDVLSGAVRSPLVLGPDTLITPSARDRAVRLGWTIVEDGAAPAARPARVAACPRCGATGCDGGCPGRGGSGSGSARLDALADGLWLVRIEGGQMVSALPASGPGVMQRSTGAARVASDAGGRA